MSLCILQSAAEANAILCFARCVTRMSPTIFQTLLQASSKVFHHSTSHLLRDCCDFFLYPVLEFLDGSRPRYENVTFEVPP